MIVKGLIFGNQMILIVLIYIQGENRAKSLRILKTIQQQK